MKQKCISVGYGHEHNYFIIFIVTNHIFGNILYLVRLSMVSNVDLS